MTPREFALYRAAKYKAMREIVGSLETVASMLGISVDELRRREHGDRVISREAELAMVQLVDYWERYRK